MDARRGTFSNPVVRGVAPDPSVCRLGDDFFLATSSFDFWPGVPIRHSTDLVHWRLIGHAVTRPAQVHPDRDPHPFVLYAPTIRHHEGTFFVACTNVAPLEPDGERLGDATGNFIVHSDDPAGDWSDAVWVDLGGFDPSLTFADSTCFFTRRSLDLARGAAGLGPIVQAEIDPFTGELKSDLVQITGSDGGFCSNDIEGPHLYKIGGTYYLFSAEGGTGKGHMQTCGRSDSPFGPFEAAPHNPVLTHRHLVFHPIQCAGHADLIEAPDGSWWALFLGTRPVGLDGPAILGRETFLAPVTWNDGWPLIGEGGRVDIELVRPSLPEAGPLNADDKPWLAGWSTRQFPVPGLEITRGRLELPVTPETLDGGGSVSAAFLRQLEHRACLELEVEEVPSGSVAGVTAYTAPQHHYDLFVRPEPGGWEVGLRRRVADLSVEQLVHVHGSEPVRLRVECDGTEYGFSANETTVGIGSLRLLDPAVAPGFGSVRLGLFASGEQSGTASLVTTRLENVG